MHQYPSCDGFSAFIAAAILCATAPASARAGSGVGRRGGGPGASRGRRMGRRMRRKEQSPSDRDQTGHGGYGPRPPQWTSRHPTPVPGRGPSTAARRGFLGHNTAIPILPELLAIHRRGNPVRDHSSVSTCRVWGRPPGWWAWCVAPPAHGRTDEAKGAESRRPGSDGIRWPWFPPSAVDEPPPHPRARA